MVSACNIEALKLTRYVIRPVEIHQMHLKPADFFEQNPALDVPALKNPTSVLADCCSSRSSPHRGNEGSNGTAGIMQCKPMSHMQGSGAINAAATGAKVDTNGLGGKMKDLNMG
jgi:primary-amine oxidase